jgi:hypothetical protein
MEQSAEAAVHTPAYFCAGQILIRIRPHTMRPWRRSMPLDSGASTVAVCRYGFPCSPGDRAKFTATKRLGSVVGLLRGRPPRPRGNSPFLISCFRTV